MNKLFNYKCPNGLPPEECGHVPQLILNVANYFQKKNQLKKDGAQAPSMKIAEQPRNVAQPTADKTRRRG